LVRWARECLQNPSQYEDEIKGEYKWKKHQYAGFFEALKKLTGYFLNFDLIFK